MSSRRFIFELFVALLLSAGYFHFVKSYAVGIPGDNTNGFVFISCSLSNFQPDQIYDVWKGRLSGMLLSGGLFDLLVGHSTGKMDQFQYIFGLYHSLWLFLLFIVVILTLRQSLFINFGIFAGLMYNFLPVSGLYFYPWDIPATLFFTLAVLLFERRQVWLMVAAICAGCFFKETVLVCALLVLFVGQWQWWKRVLVFAGMVAVYVVGKKLLLGELHIQAAALSMSDARSLADLLNPRIFLGNLRLLFSPFALYIFFINAGTLTAVLVLGWRRRFLPYMTVILFFLAGQFLYGAFNEFRIFMQILPLSLILLSERWREGVKSPLPDQPEKYPAATVPGWAVRNGLPALIVVAVGLIGLSTVLVGWCYQAVLRNGGGGDIKFLETACGWYKNGFNDIRTRLNSTLANQTVGVTNREETDKWRYICGWYGWAYAVAELKLADSLENSGRDSDAIDHYRHVLGMKSYLEAKMLPLIGSANYNLGIAFSKKGQTDAAINQFQEAIHLKPDMAEANYNLGNLLNIKGRTDEAISQYQEAIRLKPDLAEAHNNLGFCLDNKGQTEKAISQFQEAIRLKPDLAEPHCGLGADYNRKGQIDAAIYQFQEAIRLKPDFTDARCGLGAALAMKGQTDAALVQFQEALRSQPDSAEAHNNLGAILARKGQLDIAIYHFQEAVRRKPDYADARNNLAHALEMKALHQAADNPSVGSQPQIQTETIPPSH
jgi:tetratricopeptide (TPR) repeat protein/MFS family permease